MPIIVRKATLADLDVILEIRLASIQGGEQWQYRYPYYNEFPKDHATLSRRRIETYLKDETGASGYVMLAEASCENVMVPVAWAVWMMPNSYDKTPPAIGLKAPEIEEQFARRDTNPAHVKAFKRACKGARKEFFYSKYGNKQLFLHNIGTRPEYRRCGAASALIQWGLNFAEQYEFPVTLLANPVAVSLYEKLGFNSLSRVKVQVDGELEILSIIPMIKEFKTLS